MKLWRSSGFRIGAGLILALAVLGYLRYKSLQGPRPHDQEDIHKAPVHGSREMLQVAFLPVTCHLTCPVTDYASKTSTTGTEFDAMRFFEFPSIIDVLKSKKLMAGFITVPLAMKMREQGAPIR